MTKLGKRIKRRTGWTEFRSEAVEAAEAAGNRGSLPAVRQPSGMDDSGRYSGYSAGHSSDGYAGWRTVRNLRPE